MTQWSRATVIAILMCATSAGADRIAVLGGAEANADADRPAHGVVLLAYDVEGLPGGATFGAELNTDTLRLGYTGVRVGPKAEVGVVLAGEALVAGLLPDYYVDGRSVPERAISASYLGGHAYFKAEAAPRTWFELAVGARRWIFGEFGDDTAADLTLPPDAWTVEPRLRVTWWGMDQDAGWSERHRLFPRLRGVAFGAELAVDWRSEARAWGALDADSPEVRNRPGPLEGRARQWLLAGWQAHRMARLQLSEVAGAGVGLDDITRERLGGLSPYSLDLPGVPWAHYAADAFVSGSLGLHLRAADGLELGPLAGVAAINDPHRSGDQQDVGVPYGVGAFVDWRFGDWQVDARGGYSPSLAAETDAAAWTAWLSVGWGGRRSE
jgi:hypothetical protein